MQVAAWSSGMTLASGAGGPRFTFRSSPFPGQQKRKYQAPSPSNSRVLNLIAGRKKTCLQSRSTRKYKGWGVGARGRQKVR